MVEPGTARRAPSNLNPNYGVQTLPYKLNSPPPVYDTSPYNPNSQPPVLQQLLMRLSQNSNY